MEIKKLSTWDWIFWIALLVLLGWALAKSFGLINSPIWVETIPIYTVIFMAGALWQKINMLTDDMHNIKKIIPRFNRLEHEHEIAMGRVKIKEHSSRPSSMFIRNI